MSLVLAVTVEQVGWGTSSQRVEECKRGEVRERRI